MWRTSALLYRTMVPLFATTTVVPFETIASVAQTTSFGIKVVTVELQALDSNGATGPRKALTIATGLDVELLFQLLTELLAMHTQQQHERAQHAQAQQDAALLQTLLDYEDDEHKASESDNERDVPFTQALEQSEAFS